MSFTKKDITEIRDQSILYIDFKKPIVDRTPAPNLFTTLNPELSGNIGLHDIIKNLKKAKNDPKIEGIFMELNFISAGISKLQEIREALEDFKESEKFIITYSENMSQGAYYLASVSDKIYVNPKGMVQFTGLNAQVMFFKGLLEKISVETQIIKSGKFKSAVEPFILDKMSNENKQQTQKFISSIWNNILTSIAKSRKMKISDLNKIADDLEIFNPEILVEKGMIDDVKYKDEVLIELKEKIGISENKKIPAVTLFKYNSVQPETKITRSKNRIAIIYANGLMINGEGNDDIIGAQNISKTFREARNDDKIKAIVFRINSGGGDALAADIMRREIELAAKEKPVIVSYGDISASGGYWATCQATKIIANETCLTGSIGVLGIIPNIKGLLNEKLGITVDNVKSNKYSNFIDISQPLSAYEKAVFKNSIDKTYKTFIELVAKGRGLSVAYVDSIGQGRVWSGEDALKLGLIDEFGGLERAIDLAAEQAEIDDYRIRELPKQKDLMKQLYDDLFSFGIQEKIMKKELGESYKYIQEIHNLKHMNGIQARIPFEIVIE